MSAFHKLQDIYFDALKLREELDRIPSKCDCGDADAHLSGKCCCALHHSHPQSEGCLPRLEKLKGNIEWFKEDMRRERRDIRPGELSDGVEGRLSMVINLVDNMDRSVCQIEADLNEFRASCAHKDIVRIKQRGDELARHLDELNRLL